MKKIFLLLITIGILVSPSLSYAQSITPEVEETTPQPTKSTSRIDIIKNKVASRVAELNLVEKRGFIGTVENVGKNQITVTDLNNKTRIIDVDELTKFSSENDEDFDLSSIKKGTKIGAAGLYNKESRKLLARFVNEISIPLFLQGVISEKDEKNFTVKITTDDNKSYLVDIENITKSFEFNDGELESAGFSQIEDLQNALIIGFPDKTEDGRITASKIVIFPDLPKNPRIKVSEPTTTEESTTPSPASEDEDE